MDGNVYISCMDRMQIYVETEQRLRLNALAKSQGRPAAELVREAVRRYLDEAAENVFENDSLFSLIGAAGDLETATDVSSNHHRYLAMADPRARPKHEPKRSLDRRKATRKRRRRAP